MNFRSHLLITGLPGVGKTSLVTKVANNIKSLNENAIIYGFYTKEVRVNGMNTNLLLTFCKLNASSSRFVCL